MSAPNPLVAERQDSTTGITGIGIAESAVALHDGIASGSWIEGGLGLVGTGLEGLSLAIDPIGTLLQYGISWLIEHIKPLSDALDWLAGDPDTIASYAQTWRNASQAVTQARTDFDNAVTTETTAWTGDAGDAYRRHATQQSEQLAAASTSANTVGTVVEVVGVLVGVVRELVRDLVAECIATLVARIPQWLAEEGLTLGLATPHVVASTVALISKWVNRVSDVIQKLVRSIQKLRPLLKRLEEIWEEIKSGVRRLHGLDSPDTPDVTPNSLDAPNAISSPNVDTPTVSPGAVADTPAVSPDTPTATAAQSATPGSVVDVPVTPGSTTAATPGTSPDVTPGTTPGATPGTPGSTPGTTAVDPDAPTTGKPHLSDDDFAKLSTNDQLDVAQSEVDAKGRNFTDDAAAQQYGADYWNDYAQNLPADQRAALFDYTTDPPHYPSYKEINSYLRGQDPGSPQVQNAVDNIDRALAGHPIPENVVITRGTGLSHIGMDPQDMVGQVFREDAYLSTSLGGPAGAFSGKEAILHMNVPAGTPGIWVEKVGAYGAGERELLLGRGLEYRVDRVVFQGGQWHVYGEYLPKP